MPIGRHPDLHNWVLAQPCHLSEYVVVLSPPPAQQTFLGCTFEKLSLPHSARTASRAKPSAWRRVLAGSPSISAARARTGSKCDAGKGVGVGGGGRRLRRYFLLLPPEM
uniref:Uncharacterized protein n=1 Tax=Aegilops tauschii subsp. strangulata TaxID=200361 RepID=A0A453Q2H9_AEGTS